MKVLSSFGTFVSKSVHLWLMDRLLFLISSKVTVRERNPEIFNMFSLFTYFKMVHLQ